MLLEIPTYLFPACFGLIFTLSFQTNSKLLTILKGLAVTATQKSVQFGSYILCSLWREWKQKQELLIPAHGSAIFQSSAQSGCHCWGAWTFWSAVSSCVRGVAKIDAIERRRQNTQRRDQQKMLLSTCWFLFVQLFVWLTFFDCVRLFLFVQLFCSVCLFENSTLSSHMSS